MRLPFALSCLGLSLLAASAHAQSADNPVTGKALFENTAVASGNGSLSTCVSCHGSVEDRRSAISANTSGVADPYADISFEAAMTHFTAAMTNQPGMRQFNGVLTLQQVRNIAAYLADTPKTTPVSETQLTFTAALNGNSAAQTVTLRHASATDENLQVLSIAAVGAGAANFVLGKAGCEGVTLTPAGSCQPVSVTYAPSSGGIATADLVFTLRQGPATNATFERVLPLSGSVASSTTPPADDSGGGALGLGWLAGLGLAVAALARRRRA